MVVLRALVQVASSVVSLTCTFRFHGSKVLNHYYENLICCHFVFLPHPPSPCQNESFGLASPIGEGAALHRLNKLFVLPH